MILASFSQILEACSMTFLSPQQGKILIVDDVPENLTLLATILSQEGHEVRRAPNGQLALSTAPRFQPDLILLDIMMPGLDGYQVCEELKANAETRHIPVIFLSALNEAFDKVRAFTVGGVDYITKPFQLQEVLIRIRHQLQIQTLQRQLQAQNAELHQEIQERRKAELAAQKASKAKGDFLARMSHELRSPLNAILGYSDLLLLSTEDNSQTQAALNAIVRSGEHLLSLIDDVLCMAKIEAGYVALNPAHFNLYNLLLDLQQMFQLQVHAKNLTLKIDCLSNVPELISTDETKLRQVLINLLSNAVKFTQQGTVTLRVRGNPTLNPTFLETLPAALVAFSPSPASFYPLCFQVEDTGIGIASEEVYQLFQPFEQTKAGRQVKTGTGLGLAISQQFVQIMGGEIQVESTLGSGSCFSFTIPVSRLQSIHSIAESQAQVQPQPFLALPLFPPKLAYRILITDEVEENRFLLMTILNKMGFEVAGASNGQEAVEMWSTWHPDLIFMDLHMPILDGYEATQEIRRQETTQRTCLSELESLKAMTKIVVLTADVLPESHKKAIEAGCDEIMLKPYKMEALLAKIDEHLKLNLTTLSPQENVKPYKP